MTRRLQGIHHDEDGLTLIELLVIVVIIGVLAAIAIPGFLNQTSKASDARAKSAVSIAQQAIEAYWIQNDTYNATQADLISFEGSLSDAPNFTVSGTLRTFRISVDSNRGATFAIEKTGALQTLHTCTPAGLGGCEADGTWN
jgi:prepilin-type N-terminal cleavage/methylation domain-containing protein